MSLCLRGFLFVTSVSLLACGRGGDTVVVRSLVDTTEETGQEIGEILSNLDQATDGATLTSFNDDKSLVQMHRLDTQMSSSLMQTEAASVNCSETSFDACGNTTAATRVRQFAGCVLSTGVTLEGNVRLFFEGSSAQSCSIPNILDTVVRTPSFTITGLRGATFVVAVPEGGIGQTLLRAETESFSFSNSGVRKTFTTASGLVALDMTTSTVTPIRVIGLARTGRQVQGGEIKVKNNLNGKECNLTPEGILWGTASCRCPTQGSWAGSCNSGESLELAYGENCGQVEFTLGLARRSLQLDSCSL